MENPFNDNELEQLLQNETRQHRMYPSDKVWRNIHKEIHPQKSWPALTIFSLFVIVALTVLTILNNHPAQPFENVAILEQPKQEHGTARKKQLVENKEQLFLSNIAVETFASLNKKDQQKLEAFEELLLAERPLTTIIPNAIKEEILLYQSGLLTSNQIPVIAIPKTAGNIDKNIETETRKKAEKEQSISNNAFSGSNVDQENVKASEKAIAKNQQLSIAAIGKTINNSLFKKPVDDNPEMEEYAYGSNGLPKLIVRHKEPKIDFQFYITPSISYRRLVDDKERNSYQRSAAPTNVPTALNYTVNVNDVVRHKPAMGTEVGFGIVYKLNKRLKLKTGLQLNVRQYYIDGFSTNTGVATIAIVSNNKLDTVTQSSSFSNTNGYSESQLDNRLFQVSMPVGVQWDFFQGKRLGFSIGGSLQPTLTLNKNLYIISTDYKLYTDGTPFLRRWNINSSAELDITYKVGNVKWSLGPQIRYQHLPTYSEKYPIKEYRLDYGLKIGFTKSF